MGLSSALYSGTSGLSAHGEKMSTIGDNLANVSTVGFKRSTMHFEDFMPQDINTSAGVGQVGRGVAVGAVMQDFSQGSLESTNESTDVAIGGDGFFTVSAPGSDENQYTRAGNFRFNEEGFLVDPHGNRVQGWEVREDPPGVAEEDEITETDTGVEIQGAPGDIRLENFQSSPEQTSRVDQTLNLDSRSPARSTGATEILEGDEASGTEGTLRINDADYDVELIYSGGDPNLNAGEGLLRVTDDEVASGTGVFAYSGGDIIYASGGGAELRWDTEAGDYALWSGGEWVEEYNMESGGGGSGVETDFGNIDLSRGGEIEVEYDISGGPTVNENIEFDSRADLVFQLGDLDAVSGEVEYDEASNVINFNVANDIEGSGIDSFTMSGVDLSPRTASDYDVTAYTQPGYPFSAMWQQWDANEDNPLGDTRYSYQSTLEVYDENGTSYELTNYFDPVDVDDPTGNTHWEYMTTVNPENDNREGMQDSSKRGVLMTGSLTFNPGGELIGQSAYTLGEEVYNEDGVKPAVQGTDFASNLDNWTLAEFSENGYPVFTPNFLGVEGQNYAGAENAHNIEMNFGLSNRTSNWSPGSAETPAELGLVAEEDFDNSFRNSIPNFSDEQREAQSTTQFSSSSTTIMQNQDGYTTGFLQNVEFNRDGVLTARYDNGQVQDLYALTLADFHNEQGLRKEGGNLYTETRSSGPAMTGVAGTRGLGEISSNSLEQSNVDISEEFVNMITTQKGFQANSRTITTTDEMLQEVINLKR